MVRIGIRGAGRIGQVHTRTAKETSRQVQGVERPPLLEFFMTRTAQAHADEIAAFVASRC